MQILLAVCGMRSEDDRESLGSKKVIGRNRDHC